MDFCVVHSTVVNALEAKGIPGFSLAYLNSKLPTKSQVVIVYVSRFIRKSRLRTQMQDFLWEETRTGRNFKYLFE